MVQRTVVSTWCDVDDGHDEGASYTFMIRGVTYEIDLCDMHAHKMDAAIEPFVESGRRIGGRRITRPATRLPTIPAPSAPLGGYGKATNDLDKDARTKVREWARSNGFEVGDRGRISQDIYNAYQEAHA